MSDNEWSNFYIYIISCLFRYVHLQPNRFTCNEPGCDFSTRHKDTLLDHQVSSIMRKMIGMKTQHHQMIVSDLKTLHTGKKRWCCGTCGKEHRLRSGLYLCEKTHLGYKNFTFSYNKSNILSPQARLMAAPV